MTNVEEDKQAEKREAVTEHRCPALMYRRQPCGRPIHVAPPGVDEGPVCLMHSRDPNKSDAAFQEEFERIVTDAGEGDADFMGFVFPSANYAGREFRAKCLFYGATFTRNASFVGATFTQQASFHGVRFAGGVVFVAVLFKQVADFNQATFAGGTEFYNAIFTGDAFFIGVRFEGRASFFGGTFANATFFSGATFMQAADFSFATFMQRADFGEGTFKERAEFRETKFREDASTQPGPVFSLARFEKPELAVFYKTYLGQALFHNCDVSRFVFSSVRWRGRPRNGKRMVFEEVIDTEEGAAVALCTESGNPDDRNYGLIAELYQQLKKNYDDKRDYWTAGDFHYGEMEMKRLWSPRRNPVLRWLHRNLGLVAWYKYASDYGESYVKPFLRLLLVLALFTFIYPACGLHRASSEKGSPSGPAAQTSSSTANTDEINYAKLFQFLTAYQNRKLRGTVGFFVQTGMTSVSAASLRRDFADYEPQSVSGRFAALVEPLLTSTLVALFLLAVRRQFRR